MTYRVELSKRALGQLGGFPDVALDALIALLAGLPAAAALGGWLLSGRQPPAIARQPLE